MAADVILGEAIAADRGEVANFVLEDIHGDGERIRGWGREGGGEEGDEGEQLWGCELDEIGHIYQGKARGEGKGNTHVDDMHVWSGLEAGRVDKWLV